MPAAITRPTIPGMFCVTESEASTIRTVWQQDGELSAAVEVRRLFPGVGDMERARLFARTIAGWARPDAAPGSANTIR